ncbi:hypothetical protein PR048_000734 [Dryococelus australis]|uniref:Uncharacterized protein n=1 Tax=Dryococelus australis TaxID=614101 RepID=A0ABQ9IG20_9NEOP|nr:hypothetical protein PR048_000734 [Dryococelus australis]
MLQYELSVSKPDILLVKLIAEITEIERRLKRKHWRKNTASSRRRTFQTNTAPESGEEELEIGKEEELNYPHQKIRAVVDKEKKKVGSKKDRE